jgi:hypothetical protein
MSISIATPAEATTGAVIALPAMHRLINSAFLFIIMPTPPFLIPDHGSKTSGRL